MARMPVRSSKGKCSKDNDPVAEDGATPPSAASSVVPNQLGLAQHCPMPNMQSAQQMLALLNLVSAASRGGDLLSSVGALLGQSLNPVQIQMLNRDAGAIPRDGATSGTTGVADPGAGVDDEDDDDEQHEEDEDVEDESPVSKKPASDTTGFDRHSVTAFLEMVGKGKGTPRICVPVGGAKAKAKGKPKAKGKATAKCKAKATAKCKGKATAAHKGLHAKPKGKAKPKCKAKLAKKMGTLGCSKCRYLQNGCAACR